MRFVKDMYLSRSMTGRDKKIRMKLKLGMGIIGVYCIAVPLYGSDPLEIYNAAELKQRWYRRSKLLIVGLAGGRKEAEYLSANILSEVYEKQGDYDTRRFFDPKALSAKKAMAIEEKEPEETGAAGEEAL